MIKKMMALLVAISCAFGAWADGTGLNSGTDFSPLRAGSFVTGLDDDGNDTGTTYWYSGNTSDFEGTIVTNSMNEKFLDFESNITNPLYRTISGCWESQGPSDFVTTPIGTGLFIDTHVQFTPYLVSTNHPAPSAVTPEDKLIVWVRETEVAVGVTETNLIVTAGYYDDDNLVSASNYVADLTSAEVSALCVGQHRLTIKAIEDITSRTDRFLMGFVVYIDGDDLHKDPIEYTADAFSADSTLPLTTLAGKYYSPGAHKLFPSLTGVKTSLDNSVLSGVGYAGMGKIGDVFFTDYPSGAYPAFAGDDL